MRSIISSIAWCCLAAGTPAAAEELEVLPNGLPVGEVMIEDQGPYRFIVDTGASNTNILPKLRAQLPELGKDVSTQSLEGAGGAAQVEKITLESLSTQGRVFEEMPAFLLPPGPVDDLGVDGVLGADVLSRYVLEIDIPARTWELADSLPQSMLGGTSASAPIRLDEAGAPIVTVVIDGWAVNALLDTGARGSILNWKAAALLGFSPEDGRLTSEGSAKGATSQSGTGLKSTIFREVRIGNYAWSNAKLRIGDLPIFAAIGMAEGPAMILGIDAFADRRFIIDHPGNRLFIARTSSPD